MECKTDGSIEDPSDGEEDEELEAWIDGEGRWRWFALSKDGSRLYLGSRDNSGHDRKDSEQEV